MSGSEVEVYRFDASEGSDFGASPVPKKKTAAAKAKSTTSLKVKAAPTKKSDGAAAVKKKKPAKVALKKKDDNLPPSDSVSDVTDGAADVGCLSEDEPARPTKKLAVPAAGTKKSASETYQKLSQIEHVLKRPDTYIGSVEPIKQTMWVLDKNKKVMVNKEITFVPGLYKIVDEILVNAADNKQRDPNMNTLKVVIDAEKNLISVMNNGQGIPIEMHATEGCYIPELIFGHLLAGSNFDDDEKKTTGGRNGYGAKLANIFSTEFIVETASTASGKKYKQTFKDNMSAKDKPKITEHKKGDDYTKITFSPDLPKFNLPSHGLAGDMEALLCKRVYDMAGTLKDVKVYLNDERIKVTGFKKYVELYTNGVNEAVKEPSNPETALASPGGNSASKAIIQYEKCGARWEIAFTPSDGQFQQVSFCNSIATTKGGTHVDHVVKQFVDKIIELCKKKHAKTTLKSFQVRNHLWVFVNCLIENPAFDSQTKENMTLGASKFGSKCSIPEEFMKKVLKSGVVDNVINFAKFKEQAALKKTDGSKRSRITGIVKLEDANNAGTKNGRLCTLILTEGDSAKALAVSGLSVVGRDNFGVFPLRGKLLNVREASGAQLLANQEIQHIKQIMGLQTGKRYDSVDSLRYGSLMIMTDQDYDGSHIKGLIINFLDHFFPTLLQIPGFLVEFITPIVKATRRSEEKSFFTLPEFEAWKEANDGARDWKTKYYKGLGTSMASDMKKYFGAMNRHRLKFSTTQEGDRALIDMAFNKKKADDRKEWLRAFEPGTFLDHNVAQISFSEFINKELILFSMADNIRSIPSVIDGFKPGQRKVLYACFKRKLKAEIKVAQLSGYCSEHTAYHHGEVSLHQTIVGLAQNFVGSNNINILSPNGQFGTRSAGGKDAASPRYIFTMVEKITRAIFHPADDNVLTYLNDDGMMIEPEWYMPVVPMVLVNGSSGIGTGWSSDIPNYNPTDIVNNLRRKLNGDAFEPMHPWFRGFKGVMDREGVNKYKVLGFCNEISDGEWEITELPVRVWTQSYKEQLEAWIAGTDKSPALVKDYREYHTNTNVHFIINLSVAGKELVKKDGFEKVFKIHSSISTTNMVCFDGSGMIKKYSTPEAILDDFYDIRMTYYQKRKEFLVEDLTLQYERLSNQARFILMVVKRELVVSNRKKVEIVAELRKLEYRPFPKKAKAKTAGDPDADGEDEEEVADVNEAGSAGDFDYLLGMAISRLTTEQVAKLLAERDGKEAELNALLGKSAKQMWLADLDAFQVEWISTLEAADDAQRASVKRVKGMKMKQTKLKKLGDVELDSEGEEVYIPKAAAAKRKPSVKVKPPIDDKPLAPIFSKDKSKMEVVSNEPKPAAKSKKRTSADLEDPESKKPKAKKTKTIVLDSEDDDDDGFTISKPFTSKGKSTVAKQVATKATVDISDDSFSVIKVANPKVGKPNPKPASSEHEYDSDVVASTSAPKKVTTAKASAADISIDSDAPRRTGRTKAASRKYVDITSEAEGSESDFVVDDD